MAYAILAGLPPVNGLYSTFLGAVIFPFFTSWMHGSLGPFAIVSVMCKASQEQTMSKYEFPNGSLLPMANVEDLDPSVIVSTLTFLVGLCCLVFAVLKLEFFAEYFSEALVSGFITAAAIQVLVTQLDTILGVAKPHSHGFGYMFKNIYQVAMEVPNTNIVTFGIFVVSILYLCFCKFLLTLILAKIWPSQKFVIPYELILVVTMISTAYILQIDVNHNVRVVGTVPTGLPTPRLPRLALFQDLIFDAIALSIVIIAVHLSLSRIFCVKKKYEIDDNQELYAYGITLSLVGFAPVFPPSTGLGRPFIIDECGGSSPLCNIVSGLLVLTVLLVFGPLMYYLPLSALAAIVVIALRSLFMGFFELPKLWRLCKWDFSIWVVTFCASLLSDVIYGLAIGVLFELFAVSARTQWPYWTAKFNKNTESEHIAVFRLESMLLFTNATIFKKKVRQTYLRWPKPTHAPKPKIFIFDCAAMCDIDYVGLKQFNDVILELRKDGCLVYFVDVHGKNAIMIA
ncbi:unnamed protein product [Bursaphelenchus xylophilus]|uniref:(pine wood nematode) hypothetical protein n=1 Tax=Bursaphelenchus xylophilus TaxID=6326 RepID=A0A811KIK3_BURXY|nr:unnamed protein product [Bursaphelenchus xylophilus]CAG9098739.1 unnamed protein product [Bursaphelenchus xylophilus]